MARILLVDDMLQILTVLRKVFERHGHEVVTAASGEEALACEGAFDLLFSDITMPNMDGVTLAEKLRDRHPELPIVFYTGGCLTKTREQAKRLGPVFDKVMPSVALVAEVERVLAGR
jgi:CheY-like chemotaxis protein